MHVFMDGLSVYSLHWSQVKIAVCVFSHSETIGSCIGLPLYIYTPSSVTMFWGNMKMTSLTCMETS